MTTLSTHVLDTATGEPAVGLGVHLSRRDGSRWVRIVDTETDADGRRAFGDVNPGIHRLGFETGSYGNEMYPFVHVVFDVGQDRDHYHVPLLLSPYGYSTYRGS